MATQKTTTKATTTTTAKATTKPALSATMKKVAAEDKAKAAERAAAPAEDAATPATTPRAAKGGKKAATTASKPKAAPRGKTPAAGGKAKPEPKASAPKRLSALDAAAQVLAEAGTEMSARDMIKAMGEQGLWASPGGKTPDATLYSAIGREISAKGADSRFKKTGRGRFACNGKGD